MNTTDNNSNQLSLQELQQRKLALETQRNKWTGILLALLIVPFAMEHILDQFFTEGTVTKIIVILFIISLLFLGYLVVKVIKCTWGINDLEREIKKVGKQQTANPEKKKPTSGFFSTPHHTWREKAAKVLGVIVILFALSVSAIILLGGFDVIHYNFPQLFEANRSFVMFTPLWIGSCLIRYRSDLSLVNRISLWLTIILFLISLPLLYMEYKIGGWILFLASILSVINLFRFEKDVYFLKQDDMDS